MDSSKTAEKGAEIEFGKKPRMDQILGSDSLSSRVCYLDNVRKSQNLDSLKGLELKRTHFKAIFKMDQEGMTTSSEDVLLQVPQVRYKKGDGTLYVMAERIAWIMENRDTVSVSHKYADIKMQKISPEGKSKIQLQIVLHDNAANTFQFTNRMGQAAQIKDRDEVKELLVQLLPKFKRKVDKELEEKNRLLSQNPALLQLYRDLVITQVVTSQEFWSEHAVKYAQSLQSQRQDIGVNGAFLADIKPQTDGCNGLKYNLTPDIIESVFKTYPAVKQKHLECVPHKLSEAEFWTKFFQSHYFHRDRIHAGSKDIFTECAKIDDQELRKEMNCAAEDPSVDVAGFDDLNLDEGYGSSSVTTVQPSSNVVHQNMIKRFNQHSIMVLKTCEKRKSAETDVGAPSNGGAETEAASSPKKSRLHERILYEDLNEPVENDVPCPLTLTKVERYLHGPMPATADKEIADWPGLVTRQARECETWTHKKAVTPSLLTPSMAVSALGELTPGGALMKGYQDDSLAQMVPKDLEKELKNIYSALCELLRHFWASFPPTTKALEEKANNMHGALRRFEMAKIKPFEDRAIRELSPLGHELTSHVSSMLQLAYRKYNTWQQRMHR